MTSSRLPLAVVIVCVAIVGLAVGSFTAGWWIGHAGSSQLQVARGPDAHLEARVAALEQRAAAAAMAAARPQGRAPSQAAAQPPALSPEQVLAALKLQGAPARGPKTAPVTVVEFADFQCPFCSRVDSSLKQLRSDYPKRVRVVFKNFPLPIHDHAMEAHKAAVAAGLQGKFWEMHDKIFAAQQSLDRATFKRYAAELGLDVPAFEKAMDSKQVEQRIQADMAEGSRVGVRGTPTFFVNGHVFSGAQPYASFKAQVDQALAKADAAGGPAVGGTGR